MLYYTHKVNQVTNKGGDNVTHEDFEEYVLYCIDEEDFPPDYEICSCEDICKSCKFFELFGEECPCALSITCMGYDDKGKQIVASCSRYENTLCAKKRS